MFRPISVQELNMCGFRLFWRKPKPQHKMSLFRAISVRKVLVVASGGNWRKLVKMGVWISVRKLSSILGVFGDFPAFYPPVIWGVEVDFCMESTSGG